MRTEIVLCDNCGEQFEPKNGVGELKITFTDPSNPLPAKDGSAFKRPNVETIRKEELCPKCTHMIMDVVKRSLKSEEAF